MSCYCKWRRGNSNGYPKSNNIVVVQFPICFQLFVTLGLQHCRPQCLPKFARLCPLDQWCHPAISSVVPLFSFCPQSFPESGTFPMSQLSVSDNQNTGVSTLASGLPMSIQGWFPLRLTGLISLLFKELSGAFSSTTAQRHQILQCSAFFMVQLSRLHVTIGKVIKCIVCQK